MLMRIPGSGLHGLVDAQLGRHDGCWVGTGEHDGAPDGRGECGLTEEARALQIVGCVEWALTKGIFDASLQCFAELSWRYIVCTL